MGIGATNKRSGDGCGFRGEQHASPSEAPRGMKMKLVDACLSLCLTRLIFSSIFESAHAPSRAAFGALAKGIFAADRVGMRVPGSAPFPGAGRGVPPRRTLRVESPQCTGETGSPRRRGRRRQHARRVCSPDSRSRTPRLSGRFIGSLRRACPESVEGSHEAIPTSVSVGT